jgi:hypothetical protein
MLTFRSEGLSLSDIANRLNLEGIKPRTSRVGIQPKWHTTTVQRILKNTQ